MPPEPATLVALLHEAARRHGERPALSARHDLRNEVWSYQKLARRVTALALHLSRGLSLQPRDRVMVCAANGPHTVVAHLAAMQAGLTVVPMDLGASPDFIARIAALTEARLLLGGAETPRVAGVAFADLKTIAADSGRESARRNADDGAAGTGLVVGGTLFWPVRSAGQPADAGRTLEVHPLDAGTLRPLAPPLVLPSGIPPAASPSAARAAADAPVHLAVGSGTLVVADGRRIVCLDVAPPTAPPKTPTPPSRPE